MNKTRTVEIPEHLFAYIEACAAFARITPESYLALLLHHEREGDLFHEASQTRSAAQAAQFRDSGVSTVDWSAGPPKDPWWDGMFDMRSHPGAHPCGVERCRKFARPGMTTCADHAHWTWTGVTPPIPFPESAKRHRKRPKADPAKPRAVAKRRRNASR
jgi:hypothetical protein